MAFKVTRRSYNKYETTIRLLPVALLIDMQVVKNTKHDHCIHHIITSWAIPHHKPCKNKLDASTLFMQFLRGF